MNLTTLSPGLRCVAPLLILLGGCSGLKPTVIKTFPDTPSAVAQVKAGKVDAVIGDYPVMAYMARESVGRLEVAGTQFDTGTYGIAVSKQAAELHAATIMALRATVDDGTYLGILNTWAIHQGKIDPPGADGQSEKKDAAVQLGDGTLDVGVELSFAPMEFEEMGKEAGADVELARALAKQMGVEVAFKNMPFDDLLTAVENGQVDIAMSSITITEERKQLVDFVPYMEAGSGILVKKGNPSGILRLADLCDKTVALQEGTSQVATVEAVKCEQ